LSSASDFSRSFLVLIYPLLLGFFQFFYGGNMSVDATTSSRAPQSPSQGSQIFNSMYEIGINAGSGALAGWVFGIINPIGGAVFGASYALTHTFASEVAGKLHMDQTAFKVAAWFVSFIASVGVGMLAATVAGFPITILGAVGMILAMLVTSIALRMVISGAGCLSSCLAGAGLATKERL
jgi:hypothetical protein